MKKTLLALIAAALLLPGSVSAAVACPNLTLTLSLGSRDSATFGEVSRLQQFLADYYGLDKNIYVTGYFGGLTRQNVRRFQCEKMGICSGSETENGYGLVGRLTRAAMQSACGGQPAPTSPNTPAYPSCTLSVSPSIVTAGQSVTLSWAFANSLGGTITPTVGTVWQNGSRQIILAESTTFSGTFLGTSAGTALCSASVTVLPASNTSTSCIFNGQSVASGSSVTAYQSASVATGQSCQQETRTCQNGSLSGSYTYASCAAPGTTNASCSFNGQTLAHGMWVTAYQSSSVAAGSSCLSQSRTCSNGTLSGSYAYSSCTVSAGSGTTPSANTPKVTIQLPVRNSTVNQLDTIVFRYLVENCARTECLMGYTATYVGGNSLFNGSTCTTNTFTPVDTSSATYTTEYACRVMQPENFVIRASLTKNQYTTNPTTVGSDEATIYVRPGAAGDPPLP